MSVEVEGPLIAVPPLTRIASRSRDEVVLEAATEVGDDQGEAPDILVGRLPLIYWSADQRRPMVAEVVIPPPAPFVSGDPERMWADIRDSSLPIPRSVFAQGRVSAPRREAVDPARLELENVQRALSQSLSMLRRWPTVETTTRFWRSTELRGGREDAAYTERFGQRVSGRPASEGGGLVLLDRTARRRAHSEPWNSQRLSGIALALASSLDNHAVATALGSEAARYGSGVLRQVAALAQPSAKTVDPPQSSWPPVARATYQSCLRAFSDLQPLATGIPGTSPLSRLWRLYEAWVSAKLLAELEAVLGERIPIEGASGEWACAWNSNGVRVVFLVQPLFGSASRRIDPESTKTCLSFTSDLIPDVMVAVTLPGSTTMRVAVVDAKKRGVGTAMIASDVAEAASKYLWGLRWTELGSAPSVAAPRVIDHALVVSSARVPKMHAEAGLTRAVEVRPEFDEGESQLRAYVRNLIDAD